MEEVQSNSGNGLAVASLVLGILGFLLGFVGVGLLLGIAAIILGIIALRRKAGKGMAIAGIITGALGVIAGLFFILVLSALPVLQQNQRDTARKLDVSSAISAVTSYTSNHQGALPSDDEVTSTSFAQTYFSSFTQKVVVGEEPSKDTLVFERGAKCPEEGGTGTARNYNFQTKLENGTIYCQSN